MKPRILFQFILFILLLTSLMNPQHETFAQGGCFDAAGGPIPCPPEDEVATRTPTFIPWTHTFTPTTTFTHTATQTPSPTFTLTHTSTPTSTFTPTYTATASITPTPTPIPASQVVLPGAGIGALILFLIVGLLLPAIQKIKVANRGY